MKKNLKYAALYSVFGMLACSLSIGEEAGSTMTSKDLESAEKPTEAEIAEAINNPLSSLWLLFAQNDTKWYGGDLPDSGQVLNTTLIEPVMPMQVTENWKMILRPVIPIVSNEFPGSNRETGLGDVVLWTAFSRQYTPPNIFAFGPTVMMDTATDDLLGFGKWSAGPMAVAFHVGEKWIYGVVAQHWWSFAGDDNREDVSLTDIQYVLRYRLSAKTNIGFGPNIQANWSEDSDNTWTVPVGFGGDTLVKIGPFPVKVGLEAYYNVISPEDFGPEWQLRLMFVPVIGAPKWSQHSMF
jgi:hypothetical protein